jgi:uncharacterized protein YndB with AHSA1/START domain
MSKHAVRNQLQLVQQGDLEIVARRSFAHPPERVWRAITDPALIPKWMETLDPMDECQMDAHTGGSFRYEWKSADRAFFFSGRALLAEAPHHPTVIEYFNGETGSGTHVTTDLCFDETSTRMTIVMRWQSTEPRATAVHGGMIDGYANVYGKLDSLLAD